MTLRVNGGVIPEQAILVELRRLLAFHAEHMSREELGRNMETFVRKAKDQAVGARLLIGEAQRLQITVTEAEVEAKLSDMAQRAGGLDALQAMLTKQGLSLGDLRGSIRNGRRVDKLVTRLTAGQPELAETDLRAFYDAHQDQYRAPDRVQARHILVKPASEREEDRAAARAQLLELKRQVEAGGDFAHLAAACSECPSGKKTGGSLGWVARGTTVPSFDRAVFAMAVPDLSDVIETPLGFHLIQTVAAEAGRPLGFDEVRDQVRDLLRSLRREEAVARYVDELRGHAHIEDDEAAGSPHSCLDGEEGN